MIQTKRIYSEPQAKDGKRFLVDRLWPRGIKKEKAALAGWVREIAPSAGLRKWFGHDPEKWKEFQKRYARELDSQPEALKPLLQAAQRGALTLLFAAKDVEHNNAVVLQRYLKARMGRVKTAR